MRLARVTVTNYRSILAAESFDVGDYTVLVGPNNEGKSNLLRAMVLGLETIHRWSLLKDAPGATGADYISLRTIGRAGLTTTIAERRARNETFYNWERDFPIGLQAKPTAALASRVRLDFQLDDAEIESFRATVGSYNNGRLPIELLFSSRAVKLSIIKQGPGAKALASKSLEVAAAIAASLQMFNIPTARTETNVLTVIQSLVSRQLRKLNDVVEYREAVTKLDALRQTAVRELEDSMSGSLTEYLTDVRGVEIVVASVAEQSLRVEDLFIDDGVETSISEKGDGVKSLTAISLMQQAARDSSSSVALIAAIDEPEAHLHPEAIHKLKTKLLDIARTQQVIISTHAPVLVNRGEVGANVIVAGNKAQSARSLTEVRKILGVRLADNLSHAELVLLVEGASDEQALRAVLSDRSRAIRKALADETLAFIAIRGTKRLHSELLSQRNNVCRAFVVLDNDAPAVNVVKTELDLGLITQADYFLLRRPGGESELEDFYVPSLTSELVKEMFDVSIPSRTISSRQSKWSTRIVAALEESGKVVTEDHLTDLKMKMARRVVANPSQAIAAVTESVVEALVLQIESKISDTE